MTKKKNETNKEFTVKWEIQVTATSKENAAKQAYTIQQNKRSTATVFSVSEFDNTADEPEEIDVATLPDSKAEKIKRIKDILDTWGSTSVSEIGMGSSPVLSSTGTNRNNVSVLVETFHVQDVEIVTYQNETEIGSDDMDYEDLPEEIIDEILEQVEYYEVDMLKTEESCR